ncbi:hypothetical protein HDV00_006851, partial [Rhizophlyctis rosea]
ISALLADTSLDATQTDFVSTIKECGDGLLAIVNDVLDYSKVEAGKMEIEKAPFELALCVSQSVGLLRLRAAEKGVSLSHSVSGDTPRHVVGDVTRLRQVLLNLVGNAVKFTARGEVSVTVTTTRLGGKRCEVLFDVTDTGIGIPPAALDRLFQPFSQVDSSTTRKYGGTGLGLAITKQLVELMGGQMHVESSPGLGSTFSFTLPFTEPDTPVSSQNASEFVTPANFAKKHPMKILIAEDNLINQKLITKMFAKLGYGITLAQDGKEAVDKWTGDPTFDVIFMDMQMPVMDGLEATRRIRESLKGGPQPFIIALTANASVRDRYV